MSGCCVKGPWVLNAYCRVSLAVEAYIFLSRSTHRVGHPLCVGRQSGHVLIARNRGESLLEGCEDSVLDCALDQPDLSLSLFFVMLEPQLCDLLCNAFFDEIVHRSAVKIWLVGDLLLGSESGWVNVQIFAGSSCIFRNGAVAGVEDVSTLNIDSELKMSNLPVFGPFYLSFL